VIPFFVGYALLVWFTTAKHRRTLLAIACVGIGIGGLLLISYAHWLLGQYHPVLLIQGLQILMYPNTAVVGAVAVFIASMPRPCPDGACPRCHYDLAGLGYPVSVCPECGRDACDAMRVMHRPSGVPRESLREADGGVVLAPLAADRTGGGAGYQDQPGNDAKQDPADGGQLRGVEGFDGGDPPRIGARSNKFILARKPRD